jgi:hypothetical protein
MLDPVTPYRACCGDFYSSRDERALRGQRDGLDLALIIAAGSLAAAARWSRPRRTW